MRRKWTRALCLTLSTALVLTGNMYVGPIIPDSVIDAYAADATIAEDFEDGEAKGYIRGDAASSIVEGEGRAGGNVLLVSGRTQNWHTYAYNVAEYAGATVDVTAWMKTADTNAVCEVTNDNDYYGWEVNSSATANEWTEVAGTFTLRDDATQLYFSTGAGTGDYYLDDISIEFTMPEAGNPVSTDEYTFDRLTQAATDEDTGATAEMVDGKLKVTMTKQYGQVFFKLPDELSKRIVTGVTLNVTEGSGSNGLSPKILSEADFNTAARNGDVGVAYGSNSVTATSEAAGRTARYIGIMTTGTCSAEEPIVITFDSITIKSKSAERIVKDNKFTNFNGSFENDYWWNDSNWSDANIAYTAYEDGEAPSKNVGSRYMLVKDEAVIDDSVSDNDVSENSVSANTVDGKCPVVQMNAAENNPLESDNKYEFAYYAKLAEETDVEDPMVSLELEVHEGQNQTSTAAEITYDEDYVLTTEWQKISGTMWINAGEDAGLKVALVGTDGIDFCVDDLQIGWVQIPRVDMTIPDLHDAVQTNFGINRSGVAISNASLDDELTMQLVFKHFNSISCENDMKPEVILGSEPAEALAEEDIDQLQLNFAGGDKAADAVKAYNDANPGADVKMRGHVFVWHSQTPTWWFREGFKSNGDYVSKETMNARIDWYIKQVATHYDEKYPGLIYAWDVVNEQANDAGGIRMGTDWSAVYGGSDEYIMQAFKSADTYLADDTILFYNDYNECTPTKCETIVGFLKDIREVIGEDRKLGAGMQGHHDMATPAYDVIEDAMRAYAEVADVVHITELDIKSTVGLTENSDLDIEFTKQAYRYKDIYEIAGKVNQETGNKVENITVWGTHDAVSWLKTSNSVGGSADGKTPQYPLLFDDYFTAKPAYWALVDSTKLKPLMKQNDAVKADYAFANVYTYNAGGTKVSIKPVWDDEAAYLQIAVKADNSVSETDEITVYADTDNTKADGTAYKVVSKTLADVDYDETAKEYTTVVKIPVSDIAVGTTIGYDVTFTKDGTVYSYNDTTNNQAASSLYFAELTMKPVLLIPNGTAAIDGDIAEWKNVDPIQLGVVSGGVEATATGKVAWDDENLYVMMEVEDPNLDATASAGNEYQHDSMEFFIDELNEKGGGYDDNDKQYRVNYENLQTFNGKECKAEYITSATQKTADGYVIEAAIKWTALDPKVNDQIGIDLQINDAKGGSRLGTMNWFDSTGNGYQNPGVFGTGILVEAVADADADADKLAAAKDAADAIGTVTYSEDSKNKIEKAKAAYAALTISQKLTANAVAEKIAAAQASYEKAEEEYKKAQEDKKEEPKPEAPKPENPKPEAPKPASKGTSLKDTKTKATYVVTSTSTKNPTVEYKASTNSKATSVKIPDTVKIGDVTYKVTSIKAKAFRKNSKIKKVTIGKNVKTIGTSAFEGCKKLTTVKFGSSVTTVGKKAFKNCPNLKTVKLSKKVKTIGDEAFRGCKKLTSITLDKYVSKIGKNAFRDCKKLKKITIKTTKLTKKNVGANAFKGTYAKATVKVPKSKLSAYKVILKARGISKSAKIKK